MAIGKPRARRTENVNDGFKFASCLKEPQGNWVFGRPRVEDCVSMGTKEKGHGRGQEFPEA